MNKPKVIAILGPTASGKTSIGVKLAKEFNGEIVSADSRQVYRGMDIGTGKDLQEYIIDGQKIPYHLIDVAEPNETFDLAQFQKQAFLAIKDIIKRGKLPIIVGGTGLYMQSLVDNYELSIIKPDLKLRNILEKKDIEDLQEDIKNIDSDFFNKLNKSDLQNKRRLIRYLEVIKQGGAINQKNDSQYDWFVIGITWSTNLLKKRIYQRLIDRLDHENMVDEVLQLHKNGLSWEKLESFGLEYKFISQYLQEKLSYNEMVEKLNIATGRFAKRQMSWYRRWEKQGQKIFWDNNYQEIKEQVKEYLSKNI